MITADINEFKIDRIFDVVCCFGIWHGFPGLNYLVQYLKSDGIILYGLNFWRRKPDAKYITNFGIDETEKDFRTLEEMIDFFYLNGYEVLYQYINTKEEYDYYQSMSWKKGKQLNMEADRDKKINYTKWIREYHGWSAWLLRKISR